MPKFVAFKTNNETLGVIFKAISESDMAFLCKLYQSTRWQEVQQAPWSDEQRVEFLTQQFNAQHAHYQKYYPRSDFLLICQNNKNIGRIYIDRDEKTICLIDITLLPEYRNQELGSQILKELIQEAKSQQKKIVIHVEKFNPAYNWYLKHGFQQIEDKGVYQYMEWRP